MAVPRGDSELTHSTIRRRNPSRMLDELHHRGPLTRSWLVFAPIYPHGRVALLRELDSLASRAPRAMAESATASVGADAQLVGAAEVALTSILNHPSLFPLPGHAAATSSRRRAGSSSDGWASTSAVGRR